MQIASIWTKIIRSVLSNAGSGKETLGNPSSQFVSLVTGLFLERTNSYNFTNILDESQFVASWMGSIAQ